MIYVNQRGILKKFVIFIIILVVSGASLKAEGISLGWEFKNASLTVESKARPLTNISLTWEKEQALDEESDWKIENSLIVASAALCGDDIADTAVDTILSGDGSALIAILVVLAIIYG